MRECPSSKILEPTSKGSKGSAAETDPIAPMKTSKDCRCRSKTGYLVALVVIGSRNLLQPSIQAPTSHGHPFLSSITSGLDFSLNFNSLFLLLLLLLSTTVSALPSWQDGFLLDLFSTSSTLSSL